MANQSDEWIAEQVANTLGCKWDRKRIAGSLIGQERYYWGNDAYSHGAYALYGKGQWFRVRQLLARTFLHTHFAGEHLADWQGFMEGAVQTGEDAAIRVLHG
jgi:monoamine oxidase